MVALCYRAEYFHPVVSSIFLLFSSHNLIARRLVPHMVWPYSVNLECRSEMCCTRLAGNTRTQKVAKNRHLGTIAQLCRAISSQLRDVRIDNRKKLVKQQYVLQMSPQ